jgi:hypothetical protein
MVPEAARRWAGFGVAAAPAIAHTDRMRIACATFVLATLAVPAAAEPTVERVVVVGRAAPGAPWTDAATEARVGDGAELAVVAIARVDGRRVVLADPAIAPLALAGKPVRARAPLADLGAFAVRWSIVEPHGFRTQPAANGATSSFYSNVSTERGDFGRWLGYDRIEYFATEVRPWADGAAAARHPAIVTSGDPTADRAPRPGHHPLQGRGRAARRRPRRQPRRRGGRRLRHHRRRSIGSRSAAATTSSVTSRATCSCPRSSARPAAAATTRPIAWSAPTAPT